MTDHKFEGLDTLRTFMALSVATGHYFYWNGGHTLFPWSFFLAVDFFFVLSGFVLARSIFLDREPGIEGFLGKFVTRRGFRLFPLYWFLFLPATLLLAIGGPLDPAHYFVTSALLLQAMGFDAGAKSIFADTTIGIAWSISVEFWVGLLWFPLVFKLRQHPRSLALIAAFVAVGSLALISNFSPNHLNVNLQRLAGPITFGALRGLLGFALGSLAYLGFLGCSVRQPRTAWLTAVELLVIALLAILYARSGYDHSNEIIAPLLFTMLVVVAALGTGLVSRALRHPLWEPMRPLSYAIYLVHPFAVWGWRHAGLPFSHKLLPLYLVLICAASILCFRFIERPLIERGRKLASTRPSAEPLAA